MTDRKKYAEDIEKLLQLDSRIIAVKRLKNKEDLNEIAGVEHPAG